ncbi:Zn(II)2Cys6 transcription factor [Exophiala viscosa]|uniref:Zn(II)2Cys6 transcription factor n=1 Tax=Exophiala viscosa TaxID=2486360 RepID=A0AAN6DXF4_9EURO|nr:Zn(II)2Cys6 transcription factor [Exophiala viscosa]
MEAVSIAPVEKVISSCSECRRRKAKCDRGNPCTNCEKSGRVCSFEKVSRTPLTRKHLDHVEKELQRAKSLLRQYERQNNNSVSEDQSQILNVSEVQPANVSQVGDIVHPPEGSQPAISAMESSDSTIYQPTSSATLGVNDSRNVAPRASHANGSPTFSFEPSPVTGDFDWDERVQKVNQAHFIDGMASLPERSTRGYMGVASGAALLRLTDGHDETDMHLENDQQGYSMPNTPPLLPAIFSLSQLEPFIDAYFQTYHVSYPIVHEATFRAQFMEVVPRPKGNAWPVLLHIIAALGSFAASETAPEVDVALFEAAKARMSIDMLETGNIVLVQALTLISNYVQKRNKPNSGYNYLGLAKRMAMGIGLHKEFPAWQSKPMRLEIRRRVYWCLYVFDVGATITFSRPLDLPQEGIEIQLPLNVADSDITVNTKTYPAEASETTLYTHVRCQARFHLATSSIYARLISSRFPTAEEMLQADDTHLARWLQDIPSYFREGVTVAPKYRLSHSTLQWRWRNFRMLMYRPFLMRKFMTKRRTTALPTSSSDEQAIQRCLESAAESINLITNYWQYGTQNVLACWYGLYFLFQATLIPVVCLRNEPQSPFAADWRNQISQALQTISSMTRLNSTAARCHEVVMKLCGAYLAQDMTIWESPTSESPFTQLNALNSFMWPMADPQLSTGYDLAFLDSVPFDFVNQFPSM